MNSIDNYTDEQAEKLVEDLDGAVYHLEQALDVLGTMTQLETIFQDFFNDALILRNKIRQRRDEIDCPA